MKRMDVGGGGEFGDEAAAAGASAPVLLHDVVGVLPEQQVASALGTRKGVPTADVQNLGDPPCGQGLVIRR